MTNAIVTVSQLCRFVKSLLEEQKPLADLLVKGEVSNLSYRSASGHLYFSLCDGDSTLRCVMFSRYAERLTHFPEEGALVVARGTVSLYERDGSFQLLCYDLQELGTGGQQQTLDELKNKLNAEGLFAVGRKRSFPAFPKAVGVITSAEGAALQDIIATFRQLNPMVRLIVYPATVQGSGAAASVQAALVQMLLEQQVESCVIARGGGSTEDLSAFNDEALVRAVAASAVPVVSAVGHEVDYSLLDLAADARAATPTAACRLLTAPVTVLTDRVLDSRRAMESLTLRRLDRCRSRVETLSLMLSARSPQAELKKNRQTTLFLVKSLEAKERLLLERLRNRTVGALDRLELVNPAQLLRRGYTITSGEQGVVTSCKQLTAGDTLQSRFRDGTVTSTVLRVKEEPTHE